MVDSYQLGLTVIPSGCFMCEDIDPIYPVTPSDGIAYGESYPEFIYNPMPNPDYKTSIVSADEGFGLDAFARSYMGTPIIDLPKVETYADMLVGLSLSIDAEKRWAFILAPLRGAAKPAQLLQALTGGKLDIEYLPFQYHGDRDRRAEMKRILEEILARRAAYGAGVLRFGVIDTAMSGMGVEALSGLLREVAHEMKGPPLQIDFCILQSTTRSPGAVERINRIARFNSDRLQIVIHRRDVSDLIVEDWDAALGVTIDFEGGKFVVRWSSQPGQFLVRDRTTVRLMRAADMPRSITDLMARSVSEVIQTGKFKFVREVWPEFVAH